MNKLKQLAAHRHTILMWFWIAMIPVTLIWLKESVLWVALMSLYANIESSAAAREASKEQSKGLWSKIKAIFKK